MKKSFTWLLCLFVFFTANMASAQLSGIKSIPGDYPTIRAALADIQASGLSGHLVLELRPNYWFQNEPGYPLVIPENFPTSANATVTLRPSIGASGIYIGTGVINGFTVPATGNVPIFDIYGSYFNIDGRPGGAGTLRQLIIWSSGAEGSAIQFSNNASNNKISYCHLTGNNYYANPFGLPLTRKGVVTFNPAGPFPVGEFGGIHDNTLEHNLIEGAIYGGGVNGPTIESPFYAVYANGNADAPNINNSILDNDIINFTYSGIEIAADGPGAGWMIKNNSFFSTLTNYTYPEYAINIQHNNYRNGTNIIEGNFIGGNAPLAAGKWLGGPFIGIVCNSFAGGDSVSVRNNVIKNLEKINTVPYPKPNPYDNDVFAGISITNANGSNKVYCSNNLIGAPDGEYGISITANATGGDASFYGILYNNCSSGAITQNTIQNIKEASVESSSFLGIKALFFNNVDVSQNSIQQLDIQSAGTVTISNLIISDDDPSLLPCNDALFSLASVLKNTITAVSGISSGGTVNFSGISININTATISGNKIGSVTAAGSIYLRGTNVAADAMMINGFAEKVSLSGNQISNITANGIYSNTLNGMRYNGSGNIQISGNSINTLATGGTRGIYINPAKGNASVTITDNTLKGMSANFGNGVEIDIPDGSITNLLATGNAVNAWQTGILVNVASAGSLSQTMQGNSIAGNKIGFTNQSKTLLNATCNWWGSTTGPGGAGKGKGDPVGPNIIFSPWSKVATFIAVDAGKDDTIYIGYGPASKTIRPAYTVCGPVTYLWSTGATTATVTVSPTVTTTYSVTVKDANNHVATDDITIFVKDIRCGKDNVYVCHKEYRLRQQTLCIKPADVPMHLAHGDYLGACGNITRKTGMKEDGTSGYNEKMFVYPNPAKDQIILQWVANANGMALIKIIDITGRQLMQQTIAGNKGNNQRILQLKGLANGNYILMMQADGETHTMKFDVNH